MFFAWSKILSIFLDPFTLIFLMLLVLVLFFRRRARLLLSFVLVLAYVLSTPIIVKPVLHWMEGPRPRAEALQPQYDVVIVLSGAVNLASSTEDWIEFYGSVERILAGITFVKQGKAKKLLISGGNGSLNQHKKGEAQLLKVFALDFGLREEQILVEDKSRNTYENARYTADILRNIPAQNVLLITSALHMRRSAAVFHKQEVFPDLYPVDFYTVEGEISVESFIPSVYTLLTTQAIIHELVGFVMYRIQGYI